jgi:hypothetical protein
MFKYNRRTLRAISKLVLLSGALMVVLLMVAPHETERDDPPPYIPTFIPMPISPPGTAGLVGIPRAPVIAKGYLYMPTKIDSALARAVAENGHSLGGEARVNWDKTMDRGDPHFVTIRVARRSLENFEQDLRGSFTKNISRVEITTRMHGVLQSDSGIDISGGEPPTQLIDGGEHYTQWTWVVNPKSLGPHKLQITLECLITGSHVPETASVSYQDYLDVEVRETLADISRRFFETKTPDLLSVLVTAILSVFLTYVGKHVLGFAKSVKDRLSNPRSTRK